MQADISGSQRKILEGGARPLKSLHGASGIALRDGQSLPFRVTRSWSAPVGVYYETFYLIDPKSREVLFEGPTREDSIRGLQAITEFQDDVTQPIALKAGTYTLIFSLGGLLGGEASVEVFDLPAEEAA